ncbi:MAG: glycosyltransferase [Actinobacteria bacterium]|nr:glycosyltransferase [Actinomycetota bacterium]
MTVSVTLVVPSIGRPGLLHLLESLSTSRGPRPERVVVVDDSPDGRVPADLDRDGLPPVTVLRSGGRGPAAARNTGWREVRTRWVCFLDDDVVVTSDWAEHLAADRQVARLGCPQTGAPGDPGRKCGP